MSTHADRLQALREELARRRLDGFVVPLTDEHMSEYVGAYAQRLAWLTGFQGSAGTAVVLPAEAAIFVDGRYTLQVREQVSGEQWSYQAVPQTSVAEWLSGHAAEKARIGYDPWLHTKGWVKAAQAALKDKGAELVAVDTNPIDAVWPDQPLPSDARLVVQPDALAGRSSADKRQGIADWLRSRKADAAVLSALDSIAWTFNVRGADVDHTPVALAYALVNADGTADLFTAPEKVSDEVRQHLGNAVRLHPREAFAGHLATMRGKRVAADPERAVAAIFAALDEAGATVLELRDPAVLPKAIKNLAEIAGQRAAQARDGAALSRFLRWISIEAPKGGVDELSAQAKLREFREATGVLRDLSFDTISGAGPNGAVVHYRASEQTNRPLETGTLYLVDSGGQYQDGTTDVTRTVAIGTPTAEMRERFTRVLKGHIGIARAVFPDGIAGGQLDGFARQHLWSVGLDYEHGTGHGIGSYLSVHEGPASIHKSNLVPLKRGMILSNEPGYYKTGAYGIRIENLVLVVEGPAIAGADKPLNAFETISFAPIDRRLIVPDLMTAEEIAWLDAYHRRVAEVVRDGVDAATRTWLDSATAPLSSP
jgi:Xaa-Pro aminopeptidase